MDEATGKRCVKCGQVKELEHFYRDSRRADGRDSTCKECVLAIRRQHYIDNREAVKERTRRRYAADPVAALEWHRQYRRANPHLQRRQNKRWHRSLRKDVFDHYGWTCACCGTTENPSIDHVNGDGRQHREEIIGTQRGGQSARLYRWLIKNGFPDGFQTLCKPCNSSKNAGERCRLDHSATEAA